jgi:rifampicin phosphotransferase
LSAETILGQGWKPGHGSREMSDDYVVNLQEIDRTHIALAGGKAAHLGELARLDGVRVPAGFCVTTDAFRRALARSPSLDALLDRLAGVGAEEAEAIRTLSAEIRDAIEAIAMPAEVATAIEGALARLGEDAACAVRSSATAEDLPTASFAGQQDSYLNVVGTSARSSSTVRRCWASLFTERAVTYRLRNGFDHRGVQMAVVVQRMVFPQVAGVLFTADPVTGQPQGHLGGGHLRPGRGLVSGRVNPDVYRVRAGEVVDRTSPPRLAVHARRRAAREEPVEPERQDEPALTDAQAVRARRARPAIEAHFGSHRTSNGAWRRRVPDRPEPADHHALPHPPGGRGEPRLRLRRSPADDDRRHEAAGALLLADLGTRPMSRPAGGCSST